MKPAPPTTPLPPNPSKISSVTILIVALLCLLLGGGIVYAWQKYFLITPLSPLPLSPSNPSVSSFPSPSVSAQVPADWKILQSYGFSIGYPSDWTVQSDSSDFPTLTGPNNIDTISFNIGPVGGVSANETIDNYCQTRSKAIRERTERKFTLDGNPAIYCIDRNDINKSVIYFMTQKEGKQYEAVGNFEKPSENFSLSLFGQIIATFKFTDNNCGGCPQYVAPHPDACKNGQWVDQGVNECGCQLPPKCL